MFDVTTRQVPGLNPETYMQHRRGPSPAAVVGGLDEAPTVCQVRPNSPMIAVYVQKALTLSESI